MKNIAFYFAARWAKGFRLDRSANVAVIFAISIVPIIFAFGAAADYGYAVKVRAKMNAAADAAALSAVAPYSMAQPTVFAQTTAAALFNAQVSGISRLVYNSANNPQVTVTDAIVNNQRVRTATVSYLAATQNVFSQVLSMPSIAIGGTSTATASTSPNIDFYLMLDTSPSMAIPATQAGINWMVANTPSQGNGSGCAFACHEKYPAYDNLGNPGGIDNYTLARNNNVTLRMDLVTQAFSNLVTTAQQTALSTGAVYRLAGYTFDVATANPVPLQLPSPATQAMVSNINMLQVDYENVLNGQWNSDEDTNFDAAFTRLNGDMSQAGAGNGTNNLGDKPQQVLLIVTDGVSDENWNAQRIYLPLGGTTTVSQGAPSSDVTTWCNAVKNRTNATANVRIAVLYLTYNPLPMYNGNSPSWYAQNVYPLQTTISPTLQNCASSPGLFFQVNTGGDVSAAMSTLFQSAVQSARLTN